MNPDDDEFFSPFDMPGKIQRYCAAHNLPVPQTKFEIARCIYDSLALTYKHNVLALEKITGKKIEVLHIVGGGSNNLMLNQATADALNKEVTAGPSEGTALGNILTQLISLGEIKDLAEARQVVKNSTDIKVYTPQNTALYEEAYERYLKLL
jgi:rhamnulokinase